MIRYKKLWKVLIDKDLKKKDLITVAGVSSYTVNKLTTYAEMVEKLKVSRATVQRHLQELKEAGAIRRVGGTRGHREVK